MRNRYRKRAGATVNAVQVPIDHGGFTYHKWGAEQRCRPGDWVVINDGDFYTVAGDVFAATYREVRPGEYAKHTPVWAHVALVAGVVTTTEGETHYEAGYYLVSNHDDGNDEWAVEPTHFRSMYALDE